MTNTEQEARAFVHTKCDATKEITIADMAAFADEQTAELRSEVERLRMQLVACSVLATSNTPESLAKNRQMSPDYDCPAVQDVIKAVEREIKYRNALESICKRKK